MSHDAGSQTVYRVVIQVHNYLGLGLYNARTFEYAHCILLARKSV